MTEQQPLGDHTPDESWRAHSRWRVCSDHRDGTGSPSGGFPLSRALGTLLIILIWGAGQHPWLAVDPVIPNMSAVATKGQREQHEWNMQGAYNAVIDSRPATVLFSVSPPPPPVPPPPAPVVPHPTLVIPHPTPITLKPAPVVPEPVVPHPIPTTPHPAVVIPKSAPVVPEPVVPHLIPGPPALTPTFPPPVSVLIQVPNLAGYNLATAEEVLMQDGLTVGSVIKQGSGQPTGTIVRTIPEANSAVPAGTAINLIVAE